MEVTVSAWLLKTEPSQYSFSDLQREGATVWDGISNALAQKHLARITPAASLFIYHTGSERMVVGTAEATGSPYPAPGGRSGREMVIEVRAGVQLPRPVALAEIKADPVLATCDLVRLPRLSVVPLDDAQERRLLVLAGVRPE